METRESHFTAQSPGILFQDIGKYLEYLKETNIF